MSCETYSVLIRTYNCESTLSATLQSLASQSQQPSEYVIVDSGSTDSTLALLPPGCVVHSYVGARFNYSEALNQGVKHVSTEYVLIMSSHTTLKNPDAVSYAIETLNSDERFGAAYFCANDAGPLKHDIIDRSTFNGFNGLWNTCSIIRVPLLRKRPFRSEVFTAEDQEWARWLFEEAQMAVARCSGAGMVNNNPRARSLRKRANEYVAVAYYANRRLLGWRNLAWIASRVITPKGRLAGSERLYHFSLLFRLVACRFSKPTVSSRYF